VKNCYVKLLCQTSLALALLGAVGLAHAQTYPCAPVPSGLVAWYRAETNANDQTTVNNGSIVGSLGFAAGEVNQAFNFTNSGYVSISSSSNLNVGASSGFTIEGWIKPSSIATQQPLVEWTDGVGIGVHFWISVGSGSPGGAGCLFANIFDTNNTSHLMYSPANLVSSNYLQHVALTYDKASGVAVMYLNGDVVATSTLGTFVPHTTYNVFLGKRTAGGTVNYLGLMDEMSIYNRALTQCELQPIFYVGPEGKCH